MLQDGRKLSFSTTPSLAEASFLDGIEENTVLQCETLNEAEEPILENTPSSDISPASSYPQPKVCQILYIRHQFSVNTKIVIFLAAKTTTSGDPKVANGSSVSLD
jgi:hypothetical protein